MTTRTTRTHCRSRQITGSSRRSAFRLALIATTALTPLWLPSYALAEGLPSGGQVVRGDAAIAQPSASQLNVTQTSRRAVINWDGFSVGQGNAVTFAQPNSNAAVLNRVTGPLGSRIDGSITANGHVFLVNPRGVVVGPTGRVEAQGFVASSLQIDDDDFMRGRLRFTGDGASAAVANQGAIAVGPGGMAALLGGKVSNTGTIVAPLGRIGLGAGERATLDLSGDGFLQIAVPSDASGETLIEQAGRVSADGGLVEIRAATAREAARRVVNLSGVTEARSVSGRDGRIVLGGGPGGTVRVTGTVSTAPRPSATQVEASPRPAERPNIEITGAAVELAGARISADAVGGGGSIRVGGGLRGGEGLQRAETLHVDGATEVTARALGSGRGGEAVFWSDAQTVFLGSVDVTGIGEGAGGFVEISSARSLSFDGAVNAGDGGTVLWDPENFLICDASVTCVQGSPGIFTTEFLESQLGAGTNQEISTFNPGETESGRITVDGELTWLTTAALSLFADEDILINEAITAPNGALRLSAAQQIFTLPTGDVNVDDFRLLGGTWIQRSSANPSFSANDFRMSSGTTFLRATGQGTTLDPYEITDVYGLQGMNSAGTDPTSPGNPLLSAAVWELGSNIDASGTANWNFEADFQGFRPIGESNVFTGTLEGRGFAINDLTSNWPFQTGLFAVTDSATIRDLTLNNVSVFQSSGFGGEVGGLIAFSEFTTLENVAVNGSVIVSNVGFGGSGPTVGGVAGEFQGGSMSNVTFEGSVIVDTFEDQTVSAGGVAGLVSSSTGTMSNISVADSSVIVEGDGDVYVGGLFGDLDTVGDAGFTGLSVTNSSILATLDDSAFSSITDSNADVGGVIGRIGFPSGAVAVAQSDTVVIADVTQDSDVGATANVGGVVGNMGNALVQAPTAHDVVVDVTTTNFVESAVGGFAGAVGTSGIVDAVAFQPVRGVVTVSADEDSAVGGLVGLNEGQILNQDGDVVIDVVATDTFLAGSAISVGGSTGVNTNLVFDSFADGSIDVSGLGQFAVGGVAGINTGTVETSFAGFAAPLAITVGSGGSPVITDSLAVGGLVGFSSLGSILGNSSNTNITVLADNNLGGDVFSYVGGHVGFIQSGDILGGEAFGSIDVAVTAPGFDVGGFVGTLEDADVSVARTTVGVSVASDASARVGGFVGSLNGVEGTSSITDAKAFGNVSYSETGAPIPGRIVVGGFAGEVGDFGTVTRAAAEGNATATTSLQDSTVGGFAGLNFGSVTDAYAEGDATASGPGTDNWVGGFAGANLGSIINAVSSGAVSGSGSVGGAIGLSPGGTAGGVFWDITTSGQATSAGGIGLTTAEFEDTGGFVSTAQFDFFTVWAPGAAGLYPQIYTIDPVVYAIPNDETVVYNAPPPGFTGTVFGGPDVYLFDLAGDTLDTSAVFAGLLPPGVNVGIYPLTGAPSTATSAEGIVYDVVYGVGQYEITPAPLEITTLDQTRTFSDVAFALNETEGAGWSVTGGTLVPGDITTVTLDSAGEAAGAPVGVYPIDAIEALGPGVGNYDITFVELGQLTVDQLVVVIGVDVATLDQFKTYGDIFALNETEGVGWTIVGGGAFLPGDGITSIELSSPGEAITAGVGSYQIIPGQIFGTGLSNYDIQVQATGRLFVQPRAIDLTITTLDQSKVYGLPFDLDETEGVGWVRSGDGGFVNGDALTGVSLSSEGELADATVAGGPYIISVAGLSGPGIQNYTINIVNEGALDVTPAPLTLATLDQAKVFGDEAFALAETEGTGWQIVSGEIYNDDSVDRIALSSPGTDPAANVGDFAIAAGDIFGSGLTNYDITVLEQGLLSVTPRELLIRLATLDQVKTYGQLGFALAETEGAGWILEAGTFLGDDGIDILPLGSAGEAVTADAGVYAIFQDGAPIGRGLGNYTITVAETGTLTVNRAPLTIRPDDQTKVQGDVLAFAGTEFTGRGLLNDDEITRVDLFSEGAGAEALAENSPFDIEASNPQGRGLQNYDIEFEVGALTVTPPERPEPPDPTDPEEGFTPVFPPNAPSLPSQGDATLGSGVTETQDTAVTTEQSVEVAESVLATMSRASSELQARVDACRQTEQLVTDFLGCVSEALEAYSATLDPSNLDLPQELSGLSSAILIARDGIDAAQARATQRLAGVTDPAARRQIELDAIAEARAAVQTAGEEVTKAIALIRADDPELASVYRAQADTVVTALTSVETELQRAVGL